MAYTDIYAAANEAGFQGRCQAALWKAAQDILAEAPATADHDLRAAWARKVLTDRANISARQVAMQVLRNPVIAAAPAAATDNDIKFQVDSVISDLMLLVFLS
jgi:hypothetical protein